MAKWSVLGVRTVRRRLTRFTLTAIGVALGIGVLFAVLITNATIDRGLDRILGRQDVPRIQLEPAAGENGGLPISVIEAAARLPGVVSASGGVTVRMRVPGASADKQNAFIYSEFFRKGSAPSPPPPAPRSSDIVLRGRDIEADDEATVSSALSAQLHGPIGATVELTGPSGPLRFRVVGIYQRRDGTPLDDRWGNMSFATAMRLSNRGQVVDYGNIQLAKGSDVAHWLATHDGDLGSSVHLVSGSIDAGTLRQVLGTAKAALAGLAGIALFVSGFLIFVTQSLGVAEAAVLHGTLRAVGASRRQVSRVVLSDAVLLTAIAAPAGLLFGFVAALGIIRVTRSVYGLPHLGLAVSPMSALVAVLVGIGVTLVSALLPARRAGAADPVEAIRSAGRERAGVGRSWIGGVIAILGGVTLVALRPQGRLDVGSFAIVVGAVFLVPLVMGPLTAAAGLATKRLARGVGPIGVLHLRKEPRRAAYTVALIMIVLAMVFAAGATHLSLRRNLVTTLSQRFPADLTVFPGTVFDQPLHDRVLQTPGVRASTDLRFSRMLMRRPSAEYVFVTVLDPKTFFSVQGIPWADGDDRSGRQALERGGSVVISTSLSYKTHVHRGGTMDLETSHGTRRFRVAGIYKTFDSAAPVLLGIVDSPTPSIANVSAVAVSVQPGRSPAAVKTAIERRFAGTSPVFVRETSGQKHDFIKSQSTFFNLVYAIVLIALIMGMLGVTNTLAMAVLRRKREIGVLRAVGTERRYLRRMAAVESATIAFAGLVLALPLGFLLSFTVLRSVATGSGIVVPYVYPWPMFAVVAPLAVVVAVVSSIVPGRHAARVDPARVLRFD